ncbi:clathrin adaptor, mu subunit [Fistulina hepatica ATCC 64428]|uniref:Clathrin adaptor, mu subunit n=1 Tax=Fistulina hepatica ATCC 64428 TaxID=1128425 RepID=A0A0D7A6I4_9AGAR|nr:clathrin adaptor, mu subunit [Fistulina hepatica ATCC 64428]
MAIDGLIILDNTGRPIIQSGFRSVSAAYPSLHIDALNDALAKGDADPVIHVPALHTNAPCACCHVRHGDIRIVCPISGDIDPLFAFAFMQTFMETLREYFSSVSAAVLMGNFDVVYQLLEEMLDSGAGHPLTTSPNALRDIVIPPSLLNKLLGAANMGYASANAAAAFSSPIPWRKAGLRYTNNEIFFDIEETLKAIVSKRGASLSNSVVGRIQSNCKLSGTPDLTLKFSNSNVLSDCAFHPCVRLGRWTANKILSFVPPDGHFTLMDYRFTPASSTAAQSSIPLPISLDIAFDLTNNPCTFEFNLTSRLTSRAIDGFVAEVKLGDVRCSASTVAGTGGLGSTSGPSGSRDVGWMFDTSSKTLRWEIKAIPPSTRWKLTGTFVSSNGTTPRPTHAVQTRLSISSHTFSSIKVEELKMTGEMYKPYKGVRGNTTCDIEWRW